MRVSLYHMYRVRRIIVVVLLRRSCLRGRCLLGCFKFGHMRSNDLVLPFLDRRVTHSGVR